MIDPETPDFDAIGQGVLEELNRRLGSPELAADLPGSLLMKVAESYLKYLEKKQAYLESQGETVKVNPMEMINQPGLTLARRVVILSEYLWELETIWREASTLMVALMKEVVESGTVVSGMQELDMSMYGPGDDEVQQSPEGGEAEQPPVQPGGESPHGDN
jgi:hypothetical protein